MQPDVIREENVYILPSFLKVNFTLINEKSYYPDKLCGAWKDTRDADKIIRDIYKNRQIFTRDRVEL